MISEEALTASSMYLPGGAEEKLGKLSHDSPTQAEILKEHFPNTSLLHYRYTSLLGD
jgi:hypothetical protein